MPMPSGILIDKALVNGEDIELTTAGDLKMVTEAETILQTAQNRLLARRGSWIHDPSFGSQFHLLTKGITPSLVKDFDIDALVRDALQPMLDDQRLTSIIDVRIVSRLDNSIYIQVRLEIGAQVGTITYEVKF